MKRILSLLALLLLMAGCAPAAPSAAPTAATAVPTVEVLGTSAPAPTPASPGQPVLYNDSAQPPAARAADLLARMTLAEKIGQMTQVEKNSINAIGVRDYFVGSVLSGGSGYPSGGNNPARWLAMVNGFQSAALETRLGIPILYGVDAVHGHNDVVGATIFPHNVGLGATGDAGLVEQIGRATAEEMAATGIRWNFAPVVAVPQDIRWGRTYEGYGEQTELVTLLSTAYIQGLQGSDLSAPDAALATPKHYIGDGGTAWGSSTTNNAMLDQGVTEYSEADLRRLFLPPYQSAIENGARSVMVSFSSWGGMRMSAQKYLITDVLKGELGFSGFVVSDWQSIDMIDPDYYKSVVTAINAGIDMNMVPYEYSRFCKTLTQAVELGDVPQARVDDAVLRILTVKFELGLFEHPLAGKELLPQVGSDAHRALARKAAAESLVLLKNDDGALPIAKDNPTILVAGKSADDIGMQCGGWSIDWAGRPGRITDGTTILEGIRAAAPGSKVLYNANAGFGSTRAPLGIAVVGERPYAEFLGDSNDLVLDSEDMGAIQRLRQRVDRLVVVLVTGRPLVVTDLLPQVDALVAAWLPGTEGDGVADVLFGGQPFTGKTPYSWPRSMDQLPFDFANPGRGCDAPLFPAGFGLSIGETAPEMPVCP